MSDRVQRWGNHPAGPVVLLVLAVAEATVFPAPTEAMLIALALASPGRTWVWVAIATGGSVVGGVLGYAAGAALAEGWHGPVLGGADGARWAAAAADLYRGNYALALLTSGFTPIPYLFYTSAAGAADVPLPAFVAFSLLGRGLKYGVIGALARVLGPAVRRALDRVGPRVAMAAATAIAVAYVVATC